MSGPYAPSAPTLVVFALAAVLVNSQVYNVIPLFGQFAAMWNTSESNVTWLASAATMGYAASFLLVGPLTDRFDRRKMLVLGVAGTAVATLLVAFAPGLAGGIALRAFQGFAGGIFGPAAFAYIASRIAPQHRAAALSTVVSAFLAAAVVGQVSGQFLLEVSEWRTVYFASAAGLLVVAVALWLVLWSDRPRRLASSALDIYRAMPGLLGRRELAPLYGAAMTMLGGFVGVYAALQMSGRMSSDALLALRASALPAIIAVPFLTVWLKRFQPHLRARAAAIVSAVAVSVAALFDADGVALAACLFVFVGGIAASAPAINETIATRAGAMRGTAIALFTTTLMIGASLAPPLVAALAGAGQAATLLVFGGVVAIGSILAGRSATDA
jgi:predicted MFS family arabinose efflux permease